MQESEDWVQNPTTSSSTGERMRSPSMLTPQSECVDDSLLVYFSSVCLGIYQHVSIWCVYVCEVPPSGTIPIFNCWLSEVLKHVQISPGWAQNNYINALAMRHWLLLHRPLLHQFQYRALKPACCSTPFHVCLSTM